MADLPPVPPPEDQPGASRRRFLRNVGIGTAAAAGTWAAPSILSVQAAAAATVITPEFVQISSTSDGSANSLNLAAPTGTQEGDLLVAFVVSNDDSTVSGGGFTQYTTASVVQGIGGADTARLFILSKIAGPAEGPWTFTRSTASGLPRTFRVAVIAYRNGLLIEAGTPLSVTSSNAGTHTFPSRTALGGRRRIVRVGVANFNTLGSPAWTVPPPGSVRLNTGPNRSLLIVDYEQPGGGATGTATATMSPTRGSVTGTLVISSV